MTTIAYREGILAVDSRGTVGDYIVPNCEEKLFRLKDGRPAAVCGNLAQALRLLKWVDGDRIEAQPEDDVQVVALCPDGRIEVFEQGFSYFDTAPYGAYGSGFAVALGALHAGSTAVDAVTIAGMVDPKTGGDVKWMRCE